jgi:hypothetical protein
MLSPGPLFDRVFASGSCVAPAEVYPSVSCSLPSPPLCCLSYGGAISFKKAHGSFSGKDLRMERLCEPWSLAPAFRFRSSPLGAFVLRLGA